MFSMHDERRGSIVYREGVQIRYGRI